MATLKQQFKQQSFLIEEYIAQGDLEGLRPIRKTLYKDVELGIPIELIHIERREMLERIDSVLKQ